MTVLLLLLQLAVWQKVSPPVLHQGFWQSCDHAERILEHRVNGDLKWELHMTDVDFGLYAFKMADGEHNHMDPLNLLSAPIFDSGASTSGGRQWTVPSLHLWISIVRAGETERGYCSDFHIRIESKP